MIQLGENSGFNTDHTQYAYQCATLHLTTPTPTLTNNKNNSPQLTNRFNAEYYASIAKQFTSLFSQKFGGDWACVIGHRKNDQNGAVFSYYVPSIRHLCFLVDDCHLVFIAQIFEPHVARVANLMRRKQPLFSPPIHVHQRASRVLLIQHQYHDYHTTSNKKQQQKHHEEESSPVQDISHVIQNCSTSSKQRDFFQQDLQRLNENRIFDLNDWGALPMERKVKYPDGLVMFLDNQCKKHGIQSINQDGRNNSNALQLLELQLKLTQQSVQLLSDQLNQLLNNMTVFNSVNRHDGSVDVSSRIISRNVSLRDHEAKKYHLANRYQLVNSFGSCGSQNGEFIHPFGVAIDSKGHILVSDKGNHRVQVFDSQGQFLRTFGSEGHGDGELMWPQSVVTDKDDNIIVADMRNHRIQVFDTYGTFLFKIGSQGIQDGQFIMPMDVSIERTSGQLYVCDYFNNRIQIFSSTGEHVRSIALEDQRPCAISVSVDGGMYVSDKDTNKIYVLDREGTLIKVLGSEGSGDGQFNNPEGVLVDDQGKLLVCDSDNHRFQILSNNEGKCLFKAGATNDDLFSCPTRAALSPDGSTIAVADMYKQKIFVFRRAEEL